MATNPPPADGAWSQAVYDLTLEQFRPRRDDERTETGLGSDHNKWIVCPAIGVGGHRHLPHAQCEAPRVVSPCERVLIHCWCGREQVSLKAKVTPGKNGNNLKASDFKFSRSTYWMTSKEEPTVLWMEELKPSDELVRAYVSRDKSEYEDAHFCDAYDAFDDFILRWEGKTLVKDHGQVHSVYFVCAKF
jgi:hypothetical protein